MQRFLICTTFALAIGGPVFSQCLNGKGFETRCSDVVDENPRDDRLRIILKELPIEKMLTDVIEGVGNRATTTGSDINTGGGVIVSSPGPNL